MPIPKWGKGGEFLRDKPQMILGGIRKSPLVPLFQRGKLGWGVFYEISRGCDWAVGWEKIRKNKANTKINAEKSVFSIAFCPCLNHVTDG
jgi:hypothetical protein